uniref:CSON015293 protein n=1 Tax=Culicoides sonorensis TaxID=179676 RepID=A0A336ME23_CULSO
MLGLRNLRVNLLKNELFWTQFQRFNSPTASQNKKQPEGFMEQPDPHLIDKDYIGPPDKRSNLRPIVRHIPENETYAQQLLRERRLEIADWNQSFWERHNKRFYEDKAEFVRLNKKPDQDSIPADDMSKFYKYFLDKNWKIHFLYNISWYSKNFELLFLALRVNLESYVQKLKGK